MCELCNLEKKTKWYYEDDYFIVCACDTCNVPMIISRRHTTELNQEELIDLMWLIKNFEDVPIREIDIDFMARGDKKLDQNRRKIKNHWHVHIR